MTNLTKILIGTSIVGAGIVATPIIYNSQINKFINQEKKILKAQNIKLKEIKNNDDFFNIKREYIVTIKDIAPLIEETYPNIDFYTLKNLKEEFDNTKFLVTLNMLKFPVYHKNALKIDLYALNEETTQYLQKDEIGKKLLEAIKNKTFEVILDINNLKVSKAKLKDIDLKLNNITKYNDQSLNIEIKGATLNLEKSKSKIDKIALYLKDNSKYRKEEYSFNLKNIETVTKQRDLLNYSSTLNIGLFNFKENSNYQNSNLTINKIKTYTATKTITNKTSMQNKIDIKTINFSQNKDFIKIDNIKYNFNISKVDTPSLRKIIEIVQTQTSSNPKILSKNIQNLIQKGFRVSIEPFAIEKIEANFDNEKYNIKPININFDATLLPNNFTFINNSPEDLLKNINAKLNIQTYKENIELLNQKNPQIGLMINMIAKEINNKVLINLEYQKGKLTSNGKPIIK